MSLNDNLIPSFDDYILSIYSQTGSKPCEQDRAIYECIVMLMERYGVGRTGYVTCQILAIVSGRVSRNT
jgi:hypothetical protein